MANSRKPAPAPSSDVAFTDRVKAVQSRLGSRSSYARMEREGGFETEITGDVAAFVAELEAELAARRKERAPTP